MSPFAPIWMRATEVAYESDILAVQNEGLQRGEWATVPLARLTASESTNAQIAGSIKATKKKKLGDDHEKSEIATPASARSISEFVFRPYGPRPDYAQR